MDTVKVYVYLVNKCSLCNTTTTLGVQVSKCGNHSRQVKPEGVVLVCTFTGKWVELSSRNQSVCMKLNETVSGVTVKAYL